MRYVPVSAESSAYLVGLAETTSTRALKRTMKVYTGTSNNTRNNYHQIVTSQYQLNHPLT